MQSIINWLDHMGPRLQMAFNDGDRWKLYLQGLGITLELTLTALIFGTLLGLVVAVIRTAHDQQRLGRSNPLLSIVNALCTIYTTVIRGTPMLVQLYIWTFVIFPTQRNKILVGFIGLGVNSGAYVAEIIRGGLMSVDSGQSEAGRSLGLNYFDTMRLIVIPQAFKNILPSLGNEFITLFKDTSLVQAIGGAEMQAEMLEAAQATVDKISVNFRRGLITEEERYRAVVETWNETDKELTEVLLSGLDKYNNIHMMADSGARGSNQQIKQLAGMRGLMADTTGRTIELPIKSNFREGLDVLEYFMSAHGARKGLSDTALRTADSGYLTRRMVDVSQELIIRETDCCEGKEEIPGMTVKAFMDGKETIEGLKDRITGRFSCEDILDKDGNMIVKRNHMITPARAEKILSVGVNEKGEPVEAVKIRTILTCRSHVGICAKCYGANMATGEAVQVGEAVGIIAAQSIGEPGTQLTMRTFHTGGVAGDDITQGLPRVEELFEARKPKGLAIIAEFGGVVAIKDTKKKREIIITNDETGESKTYLIPYGSRIKVLDGATLEAGDELTEGSVNPHDLLKIKGIRAVQDYMLREVQRVYRLQGVDISDKHIEVIVRQMLKKVRIENNGDTDFLPGTLVDVLDYEDMNEALVAEGKEPAEGKQILLGITKAALATDSFLSAASFQETTKVLTEAAIKGKVDSLIGLKENVIIGKLIPAGTGMRRYRDTRLSTDENLLSRLRMEDEFAFDEDPLEDEDFELAEEIEEIEGQEEDFEEEEDMEELEEFEPEVVE